AIANWLAAAPRSERDEIIVISKSPLIRRPSDSREKPRRGQTPLPALGISELRRSGTGVLPLYIRIQARYCCRGDTEAADLFRHCSAGWGFAAHGVARVVRESIGERGDSAARARGCRAAPLQGRQECFGPEAAAIQDSGFIVL